MSNCIRTNSENEDFQKLVKLLDADLKLRDGEEHLFYNQLNKIDRIQHVLVANEADVPVGCGAIRAYDSDTMEVKRMYVVVNKRGQGIASTILKELEYWAVELNYHKCVLETGKRQPEAIALYKRNGYKIIPAYGEYKNIENSVCFEKLLEKQK